MALYGHEIDETTTPFEAGPRLGGQARQGRLRRPRRRSRPRRRRALPRKLVGFEVQGRGIARQGHRVLSRRAEPVGTVTSGTWSPTFEKALGMAYVPPASPRRGPR